MGSKYHQQVPDPPETEEMEPKFCRVRPNALTFLSLLLEADDLLPLPLRLAR